MPTMGTMTSYEFWLINKALFAFCPFIGIASNSVGICVLSTLEKDSKEILASHSSFENGEETGGGGEGQDIPIVGAIG